jgi:hypothetical protein
MDDRTLRVECLRLAAQADREPELVVELARAFYEFVTRPSSP